MKSSYKTISVPSLSVQFDLRLQPHQIPQWRGAVAEAAGWEHDLFHNHDNSLLIEETEESEGGQEIKTLIRQKRAVLKERYHYRYPLIQYRVEKGKAAIFALGEACKPLRNWLLRQEGDIRIFGKKLPLRISQMQERDCKLGLQEEFRSYRIMDYISFQAGNYKKWQEAEDMIARIRLLQKVMQGHILFQAGGLGYHVPGPIEVKVMNIGICRSLRVHGVEHLGFNLLFKSNMQLISASALGKAVSHGFGRLEMIKGAI